MVGAVLLTPSLPAGAGEAAASDDPAAAWSWTRRWSLLLLLLIRRRLRDRASVASTGPSGTVSFARDFGAQEVDKPRDTELHSEEASLGHLEDALDLEALRAAVRSTGPSGTVSSGLRLRCLQVRPLPLEAGSKLRALRLWCQAATSAPTLSSAAAALRRLHGLATLLGVAASEGWGALVEAPCLPAAFALELALRKSRSACLLPPSAE